MKDSTLALVKWVAVAAFWVTMLVVIGREIAALATTLDRVASAF